MKYGTLMRHAKTEHGLEKADHERALTQKGHLDAALAGRRYAWRFPVPGTILCSSALRARQTVAAFLGDVSGLDADHMAQFQKRARPRDSVLSGPGLASPQNADGMRDGMERVMFRDDLYLVDAYGIWMALIDAFRQHDEVVIVAHNPGIASAVDQLAGARLNHVPPCTVLRLAFEDVHGDQPLGQLAYMDTSKA